MNNIVTIIKILEINGYIYLITKFDRYRICPRRAGGHEMFEAYYQTHRGGKPIKNPIQIARWRFIAYFESLPELREGGRVPLMDDNGNFPKMDKRKRVGNGYSEN